MFLNISRYMMGGLGSSRKPLPLCCQVPDVGNQETPKRRVGGRHALALKTPRRSTATISPSPLQPARRRPQRGRANIHPWRGNQSEQSAVQTQPVHSLGGRKNGGEEEEKEDVGPVSREGALDLHCAAVSLRGRPPGQGALVGLGDGGSGGLHRVPPDADVLPPALQDRTAARALAAPGGERVELRAAERLA